MEIHFFKFAKKVRLLTCLAILSVAPAVADETTTKSESKQHVPEATEESKSTDPKEQAKKNIQSQQRFEIRLPFDRSNQNLPSAMAHAFASSNSIGPVQKIKLRKAIGEVLEQNGISSAIVEKTLDRVDNVLHELTSQTNFSWRGSEKLPFRVGIGCKFKDPDDKTPGLEVERVFEDSPAAAAGLKPGDRLISIDGQPIHTIYDMVAAVQKAGGEVRSVRIDATRGEVSISYEVMPNQTAVAELNIEMMQPGAMMMPPQLPGQAWVMPQWPMNASLESTNEKNIDELRQELEEMKSLLKKLSEKP